MCVDWSNSGTEAWLIKSMVNQKLNVVVVVVIVLFHLVLPKEVQAAIRKVVLLKSLTEYS